MARRPPASVPSSRFVRSRHRRRILPVGGPAGILAFVLGIVFTLQAAGGPPLDHQETQLGPIGAVNIGTNIGFFGGAIALDGDLLVVGATEDDEAELNAGAVHVFEWDGSTWQHLTKLLMPTEAGDGDRFGAAVDVAEGPPGSLLGDFIVVGAPEADFDDGRAFVFHRAAEGPDAGVWVFDEELRPVETVTDQEFGASVAIDVAVPPMGMAPVDPLFTIVVGSPNSRRLPSFDRPGGVHIYQYVGSPPSWNGPVEFFSDHNGTDNEYLLGSSVAIDGPLIVAGAPIMDTDNVQDAGAAYFYTQGNEQPGGAYLWAEAGRLKSDDPTGFDRLGGLGPRSVAVDGEDFVALVGAPRYGGHLTGTSAVAGSVLVFDVLNAGLERTQVQTLTPSDGQPGWMFGESVAMDGPLAAIGAPGAYSGEGAIYFFARTSGMPGSWVEIGCLRASDPANNPNDRFGSPVDLSGRRTATGVAVRNTFPDHEGVAYVFDDVNIFADGFESGDTSAWQ